jgi:tRNA 2-thiouridine synthesizing protein A
VEIVVDVDLDLRDEVCPYTYVKSRLALEEMGSGQVLRITVDHPPAVQNVPRALRSEGHEVLDVTPVGESTWVITVRKA